MGVRARPRAHEPTPPVRLRDHRPSAGCRFRSRKDGYARVMNGAFDDLRAALRERVHIADLLQARGVPVRPKRARRRDRPVPAP
jgi:hypothetical protein